MHVLYQLYLWAIIVRCLFFDTYTRCMLGPALRSPQWRKAFGFTNSYAKRVDDFKYDQRILNLFKIRYFFLCYRRTSPPRPRRRTPTPPAGRTPAMRKRLRSGAQWVPHGILDYSARSVLPCATT